MFRFNLNSTQRFFSTVPSRVQRINIIHLKQVHADPEIKGPNRATIARFSNADKYRRAVKSQFAIANFLSKLKNPLVVDEHAGHDWSWERDLNNFENWTRIKKVFPLGDLPEQFDQLSQAQQDFLHNNGGAFTLLFNGKLKRIYRSTRQEVHNKVWESLEQNHRSIPNSEEISLAEYDLSVKKREAETLFCCKELALRVNQPVVDVHLLFGEGHNFKRAIIEYNDPLIKFAGEHKFEGGYSQEFLEDLLIAEFYWLLQESDLKPDVEKGILNLDTKKPWILKALGYHNFRTALDGGIIKLTEVQELTEDQVDSLKKGYQGKELKEKILQCIEANKRENQAASLPKYK